MDDMVITGLSLAVVKETFISMEKAAKEMGLTINENKNKFMALNDPAYSNLMHNQSFIIESYNFEVVMECIYLGILINCKNDLEEEIKHGIITGNRCYYSMSKLMKSQSESWALSKSHEVLLGDFERKILRRIYGATNWWGLAKTLQ